jgi:hypothetical protein
MSRRIKKNPPGMNSARRPTSIKRGIKPPHPGDVLATVAAVAAAGAAAGLYPNGIIKTS